MVVECRRFLDIGQALFRCVQRPHNSGDLTEMKNVMAGVEPHHVADAFFPTFIVRTHPFEVPGRGPAQEPEVGFPQECELRECLSAVRVVVVEAFGPEILVVSGQPWAVLRQHHAEPVAPDELRVGQVLNDVT